MSDNTEYFTKSGCIQPFSWTCGLLGDAIRRSKVGIESGASSDLFTWTPDFCQDNLDWGMALKLVVGQRNKINSPIICGWLVLLEETA